MLRVGQILRAQGHEDSAMTTIKAGLLLTLCVDGSQAFRIQGWRAGLKAFMQFAVWRSGFGEVQDFEKVLLGFRFEIATVSARGRFGSSLQA